MGFAGEDSVPKYLRSDDPTLQSVACHYRYVKKMQKQISRFWVERIFKSGLFYFFYHIAALKLMTMPQRDLQWVNPVL